MAIDRETAYLGRDNTIDRLLKEAGTAKDLAAVTRMTLELMDKSMDLVKTVDSAQDTTAFDWDTDTTGKVIIALGGVDNLDAGEYWARLTLYDSSNERGIAWGSDFLLTVKAEPA